MDINQIIAKELNCKKGQVEAAVRLIDEGSTVPFIARYRKEATGGLDDGQLRILEERLGSLRALEDRKAKVIAAIDEQGKLTEELRGRIEAAQTLSVVEDLYQPYKQKRRTRASIAKEKGLQPLADMILALAKERAPGQRAGSTPEELAERFLASAALTDSASAKAADSAEAADKSAGSASALTVEETLQGASDIIAEQLSDDADIRARARELTFGEGTVVTAAKSGAKEAGSSAGKSSGKEAGAASAKDAVRNEKLEKRRGVYDMYASYEEAVRKIPGHRVLAVDRGEKEGFLTVKITAPEEEILEALYRQLSVRTKNGEPVDAFLQAAAQDAYKRLLAPAVERAIRSDLTEKAEDGAIKVFRENLRQLLLQPPIAGRVVLGWDPAFRTGCKIAVVDATGKVLDTTVVFPTAPQLRIEEAKREIRQLIRKYGVTLISLGNGTASRESEQVVAEIVSEINRERLSGKAPAQGAASGKAAGGGAETAPGKLSYIIVNEAGASVYSASSLAAEEFPDLDVGKRSAASMARRLQDPLAELVKIDPKSIGVGQYQHDINQTKLGAALSAVVEDCVNRVGVDLNTASFSLLSYIAGISPAVARNIVAYRDANGGFRSRRELLKVPKLGPKAYEQCAGFLRIRGGKEPLDMTAVHPENYEAVKMLFKELGLSGDADSFPLVNALVREEKQTAAHLGIGVPTLHDILEELKRPGRDPRGDMPAPVLRSDVLTMEDLKPGMKLKGTVRNIVDFGAFVDIGVHQDGLVHISRMADRYIKHPLEVVHVGDVVDVTVLSVDLQKKRIALSMKSGDKGSAT